MTSVTRCPHCSAQLALPRGASRGDAVCCPSCGDRFALDELLVTRLPVATLAPPEELQTPPPQAPSPISQPAVDQETPAPSEAAETLLQEGTVDLSQRGDTLYEPTNLSSLLDHLRGIPGETTDSQPEPEPASQPPSDHPAPGETVAVDSDPSPDSADHESGATVAFAPGVLPDFSAKLGLGAEPNTPERITQEPGQQVSAHEQPAQASPAAQVPGAEDTSGASTSDLLSRDFGVEFSPSAAVLDPHEEDTKPSIDPASFGASAGAESAIAVARPRTRRRSLWPRALMLTAVAGVGLCLGYGALIATGGRGYDSLGLMAYLPEGWGKDSPRQGAEPDPPPTTPPAGNGPSALLAGFDSPSDAGPGDLDRNVAESVPSGPAVAGFQGDLRFGPPAARGVPLEPAPLKIGPAAPLESPPVAVPKPLIQGAPLYSFDDLVTVLQGAEQARTDLASHEAADPQSRALVGRSYAKLCEVAQILSFLDSDASHPDLMMQRLQAQDLFARLFRHQHARDDSCEIAPRWIAWGGRTNGGVFFCGLPRGSAKQGSVYEFFFRLDGGSEISVLSKKNLDVNRFRSDATSIGVVGCVIEEPTQRVEGYTGSADRAVWIAHTISLSPADQE